MLPSGFTCLPNDLIPPIRRYLRAPDLVHLLQTNHRTYNQFVLPVNKLTSSWPIVIGEVHQWNRILWHACSIDNLYDLETFFLQWDHTDLYSTEFVVQQCIRLLSLDCAVSMLDRSDLPYRDSPELVRYLQRWRPAIYMQRWISLGFVNHIFQNHDVQEDLGSSHYMWVASRRASSNKRVDRATELANLLSIPQAIAFFQTQCANTGVNRKRLAERIYEQHLISSSPPLISYVMAFLPYSNIQLHVSVSAPMIHALIGDLNDGVDSALLVDRVPLHEWMNYSTSPASVVPWVVRIPPIDSQDFPYTLARQQRVIAVIHKIKERTGIQSFSTSSLVMMMNFTTVNDPRYMVEFWIHGLDRSEWFSFCGRPYTRSHSDSHSFPVAVKGSGMWNAVHNLILMSQWTHWLVLARSTNTLSAERMLEVVNDPLLNDDHSHPNTSGHVRYRQHMQYTLMCLGIKSITPDQCSDFCIDPILRWFRSLSHSLIDVLMYVNDQPGFQDDHAMFRVIKRMAKLCPEVKSEWERVQGIGQIRQLSGGSGFGVRTLPSRYINDPECDRHRVRLETVPGTVFWKLAYRMVKHAKHIMSFPLLASRETAYTRDTLHRPISNRIIKTLVHSIPGVNLTRYHNYTQMYGCHLPIRTLQYYGEVCGQPCWGDWSWTVICPTLPACDQCPHIGVHKLLSRSLTWNTQLLWAFMTQDCTLIRAQLTMLPNDFEITRFILPSIRWIVHTAHWDVLRVILNCERLSVRSKQQIEFEISLTFIQMQDALGGAESLNRLRRVPKDVLSILSI
jgi:hypothetical protein